MDIFMFIPCRRNRINGAMVSMFSSIKVDHGFKLMSGQTEDLSNWYLVLLRKVCRFKELKQRLVSLWMFLLLMIVERKLVGYLVQKLNHHGNYKYYVGLGVTVIVFSVSLNNISVISWLLVLLVEETRVPGENHWPASSQWQTLSHNVLSSTPRLSRFRYYEI